MNSKVVAVSRSEKHTFSKKNIESINLIYDFGVEGDAHAGKTIKHIFLARKDPGRKNIRQVHLIQMELIRQLKSKGFSVNPGQLGENITTQGIDLLSLPTGCKLHIGEEAVIELTALRSPCVQIDNFQKGILKEVIDRDDQGKMIRKIGVMGIVTAGGTVKPSEIITIEMPDLPHRKLEYVW